MEIIMGNNKRIPLGGGLILAAALLLPGCIPLPINLAFNGLSYAASGKSVSDHFLTVYMRKDCSVGRAVINQSDVCKNPENQTIIVDSQDAGQNIEISTASSDDLDGGEE